MRPRGRWTSVGMVVVAVVAVLWPAPRERAEPERARVAPPLAATPASEDSRDREPAPRDPARALPTGPNQDPQDYNPQLAARLNRPLKRRPAFQHLPFRGDGIAIDFVGADGSGRVKLVVQHEGSRAAARDAYRRYLAYWRDDGRGYVVSYRRLRGR